MGIPYVINGIQSPLKWPSVNGRVKKKIQEGFIPPLSAFTVLPIVDMFLFFSKIPFFLFVPQRE